MNKFEKRNPRTRYRVKMGGGGVDGHAALVVGGFRVLLQRGRKGQVVIASTRYADGEMTQELPVR